MEHDKLTIINSGNHGEKLYKIGLWTGLAWIAEYGVYAYNEQEACDILADYVEENEKGMFYEYAYLFEHSDYTSVDEYAEAHNLTCCGNHGIYLEIANIEEVIQNERQN